MGSVKSPHAPFALFTNLDNGVIMAVRVLLVEDNVDHAVLAKRAMEGAGGFEVVHVRSGGEAIAAVERGGIDACVLDYRLPDWEGINLCKEMRARGLKAPIVLITAAHSERLVSRAFDAGADDYVVKGGAFAEQVRDSLHQLTKGGAP